MQRNLSSVGVLLWRKCIQHVCLTLKRNSQRESKCLFIRKLHMAPLNDLQRAAVADVSISCTALDFCVCLSFVCRHQVRVPRRLHGGDQHGPRSEGPAHQTGVSASVSPCSRTGSPGPGGQPPAAWWAFLHHVYEGLSNTQGTAASTHPGNANTELA